MRYTRNLSVLLVFATLALTTVKAQDARGDERVFNESENESRVFAPGATITVTSTADVIDAAANCPAVTLASLPGPNGVTSLREAVCAANNNAGADTITFAVNGTFAISGAVNEDNGTSGDLDVKDSLTVTGNGSTNTILSGGGIERVFDVFPSAAIVFNLNSLTVTNSDTRSVSFKSGGAIYLNNNVTTTINSCEISDNFSGGEAAIAARGPLTIINSVIARNQSIPPSGNPQGGAIRAIAALSINNSTIADNSVQGTGGGMVINLPTGTTATITNSTFSGNSASVANAGTGNGGGISTEGNEGTINITNSTFSGNRAENNGGGLYVATGTAAGNITLTNVTITNNYADNDNNNSGTGGGISRVGGNLIIRNTIVAGNFNSTTATRDDINGTIAGGSINNLVGDGTGSSGLTNGVSGNQVGSSGSPINPQLGGLANNGGSTQTHALLLPSPAIDKGDNGVCPATDQRGTSRPLDGDAVSGAVCDIGSYEFLRVSAATVTLSGRISNLKGHPLTNVTVSLTSPDGTTRETQTNAFGYYYFTDVEVGQVYIVNVVSKRNIFLPQVISVTEDLTDLNFTSLP